jgi:type VI secretion system protein ImpC
MAMISQTALDQIINEIDRKLSVQLDVILHHPKFQKLESAWRSLKFLVDRTDFRENIQIGLLNVTKEELLEDLLRGFSDITKSELYKVISPEGYDALRSWQVLIGNYEFNSSVEDINLLKRLAALGAMCHAPFISAVSPAFFGFEDFFGILGLRNLKSIFESRKYIIWQNLRESEDARYICLTLPRFLLRSPYGPDLRSAKAFNYKEDILASSEHCLWGNTAFALASRLTDSFVKYRLCINITGRKEGGKVENLPFYRYEAEGGIHSRGPTEIMIAENREFELCEAGFIPLCTGLYESVLFCSAYSIQKPKFFGTSPESKQAQLNSLVMTKLPYILIINRFAHYIKAIHREHIEVWKERADLEKGLNTWILQYVSAFDKPPSEVRRLRPLRDAEIQIMEVEGEPYWCVRIKITPHFEYMGDRITLFLSNRLEKSLKQI